MSTGTPEQLVTDPDWDVPTGPAMTLAEFHELEDDPNVERMLIRGILWESPMTKRTRDHSRIESRISQLLGNWADEQPLPRPEIYSGEIGCDLPELETGVGIDVAVVSAELEAKLGNDEKYIIGVPTLVVEVLSPTDRVAEVNAKLDNYLAAGVPMIWVVDPFKETIVVHRPDREPQMFTKLDELSGSEVLPGFSVAVKDIFNR